MPDIIIGKRVLYDQPTHIGHESVDCRPLVDCSSADCCPFVGQLLAIRRPFVGRLLVVRSLVNPLLTVSRLTVAR